MHAPWPVVVGLRKTTTPYGTRHASSHENQARCAGPSLKPQTPAKPCQDNASCATTASNHHHLCTLSCAPTLCVCAARAPAPSPCNWKPGLAPAKWTGGATLSNSSRVASQALFCLIDERSCVGVGERSQVNIDTSGLDHQTPLCAVDINFAHDCPMRERLAEGNVAATPNLRKRSKKLANAYLYMSLKTIMPRGNLAAPCAWSETPRSRLRWARGS